MRVFTLLWAGQAVSLIGSAMTAFGAGVWVYLETGSPTYFALLVLAASLPGIALLPVAGAIVDRWDRRRVMLLSDTGSAVAPAVALLLLSVDALRLWQLYLLATLLSLFKAFQWPAFSALVPQIVPREKLSRANGRVSLAEASGEVLGALLGGGLYAVVGLHGLLLVDTVTFALALGTTLGSLRWLPAAPRTAGDRPPMRHEMAEGWRYIRQRPGLLGLLVFFATNNFGMQTVIVLVPPLVLTLTSPAGYGVIEAVGWAGMVTGGAVMSLTREPRHRVRAILVVATGHAVLVVAMGAAHTLWVVGIGMFGILGGYAVTNAVTATLWQVKTPVEVQGRVFAVRRMIAWSAQPLAYAVAGPLAQFAAAPLVTGDGPLAGTVGRLTGTGPAAGIALVFLVMGPVLLAIVLATHLRPRVRHLERELPDALVGQPAAADPDRQMSTVASAGRPEAAT